LTYFEARLGALLRAICVTLLVAILLLMVANVCDRFVNIARLDWNDEIIELMLVWLVFLGSAEVWRINQHFAVDLVPSMAAGTRFEKALLAFISLGSLVFILMLAWKSSELFERATDVSPYFSWPRKLWYGAMPVSSALMAFFSLRQLIAILKTPAAEFRARKQATDRRLHAQALAETRSPAP